MAAQDSLSPGSPVLGGAEGVPHTLALPRLLETWIEMQLLC